MNSTYFDSSGTDWHGLCKSHTIVLEGKHSGYDCMTACIKTFVWKDRIRLEKTAILLCVCVILAKRGAGLLFFGRWLLVCLWTDYPSSVKAIHAYEDHHFLSDSSWTCK